MMKLDWKIYSIVIGLLLLAAMIVFLEKVFFFLAIASATALLAVIVRFLHPVKYLGIELITLSTMLIGVVYGPVIGGYMLSLYCWHILYWAITTLEIT